LAAQAKTGAQVTDDQLVESLRQAVGSRLVIKAKWRRIYDDGGVYSEALNGYDVTIDRLEHGEAKILEAFEFFNRPVMPDQIKTVVGMLTRMRVSLMRRNESDSDAELLIDTALTVCKAYPFDIVMNSMNGWLTGKKFFPLPVEMKDELDAAVMLRRSLLAGFTTARRHTLAPPRENASLPRNFERYEVSKARWSPKDWDDHVADAERMLELARQNPAMMNVQGWHDEVSHRMAQRKEATHAAKI
jgi:hypothetical protein